MKERLPAETVFEQIPHIRSQLVAAAEKMRDSFKPTPPAAAKKPDAGAPAASATKVATAGAPVMASTKGELTTPVARAKSAKGSEPIAAPVVVAATKSEKAESVPPPPKSAANAKVSPAPAKPETIGTPTARVQSDPPGAVVARADIPAGDQPAPTPPVAPPAPMAADPPPAGSPPAPPAASPRIIQPPTPPPVKAAAPAAAKPATPPAAKPAAAKPPVAPADPASEQALVEFIDRQILPYLRARRGDRM